MKKIILLTVVVWSVEALFGASTTSGITFKSVADKVLIELGRYDAPTLAAKQVEVREKGLALHFDADKILKPTSYATIVLRGVKETETDLYGKRYELRLKRLGMNRATKKMAVNLNDRDGETFQFLPTEISIDDETDEMVCTYEFIPANHGTPWHNSPQADGKFDGPAVLRSFNVHFTGSLPNSGTVEFRTFAPARNVAGTGVKRDIETVEPIAVKGVWPGPAPFHGPEWLEFAVDPSFKGPAKLTLTTEATHFVFQAPKMSFTSEGKGDGTVRFACNLPYDHQYHFFKLEGPKTVFSGRGGFRQSSAEAIRVEIDTGNPLHIVRDGKAGEKAMIVVRNEASRAIAVQADFRLRDVFGRKLSVPFDRRLAAGETVKVEVPSLPAKGVWYLNADVKAEDGSVNAIATHFARIDLHETTPFLEKPKFRFGIHYHCSRYLPDQFDVLVDALVASGAKFTRSDYDFTFAALSRKPGQYDFSISDPLIRKLRAAGLSLDIICYSPPLWALDEAAVKAAKSPRRRTLVRTKPGVTRDFCRAFAERYGTQIDYYEVGNEWDIAPAANFPIEDMLMVQKEAYEGLHAGNPNVCVMPNGWAACGSLILGTDPMSSCPGAIEAFALHPELYDAWSIHAHGTFPGFVSSIQGSFLPLYENNPLKTRPWICGETADTCYGGEEKNVAKAVWAKTLYAWAWGCSDYIWYNLKATGWFDGGESGYGLLTADLKPRASFAAFAAVTTVFQGLDADGRIYSSGMRNLLRFKGEKAGFKGVVLAGWDWFNDTSRTVRIRTDAKSAEVSDHMGNRMPAEIAGGKVLFTIDDSPRALILGGATFAEADDPAELLDKPVEPRAIVSTPGKDPDFVLDSTRYVFNLLPSSPETAHRRWANAADCSAKVWLSRKDDGIKVRVDVIDDKDAAGDAMTVMLDIPGRGKVTIPCEMAPGVIGGKRVENGVTRYAMLIDGKAFGFDAKTLESGLGFSVRVVDDDGEGAECGVQLVTPLENLVPVRF